MRNLMANRRKAAKAAQEAEESGNVIDGTFTPIDAETPSVDAESAVDDVTAETAEPTAPKEKPRALTHDEIVKKHRSEGQQKRLVKALEAMPDGVNASVTLFVSRLTQFAPIDYLHDPIAVYQRFDEFVQYCAAEGHLPTASNFALALGMSRQRMYQLANGKAKKQDPACCEAINWCLSAIAGMLEQAFIESKVPPIPGIFLFKANHGYSDSNAPQLSDDTEGMESHKTADEIRKKYEDIE